jgi:hypothetical protein
MNKWNIAIFVTLVLLLSFQYIFLVLVFFMIGALTTYSYDFWNDTRTQKCYLTSDIANIQMCNYMIAIDAISIVTIVIITIARVVTKRQCVLQITSFTEMLYVFLWLATSVVLLVDALEADSANIPYAFPRNFLLALSIFQFVFTILSVALRGIYYSNNPLLYDLPITNTNTNTPATQRSIPLVIVNATPD